jgi:hypothetical protein
MFECGLAPRLGDGPCWKPGFKIDSRAFGGAVEFAEQPNLVPRSLQERQNSLDIRLCPPTSRALEVANAMRIVPLAELGNR